MRKKTIIIAGAAAAVLVVGLGGTGIAYAVTDGFEQSDELTGAALDRASSVALDEIGGGRVTSAEVDDSRYELDLVGSDGVSYDVVLDGSFGVVSVERDGGARGADGSDGSDGASRGSDGSDGAGGAARDRDDLVGEELQKASEAAIAAAGGGTVTDAERSDDADHAFEVEVRLADGTEVDVELDSSYTVTRTDR